MERPFLIENFLASLSEAFKIHGDARAITTIVEGDCRFESDITDFDVD